MGFLGCPGRGVWTSQWAAPLRWSRPAGRCGGSNRRHVAFLTCACLVKTEATTVRVSPENPRVPRSHTLELRCASRCDPHLGPSLTLAWSKDGDALQTNGTEDGRWAGAGVGTGVPV